MDTVQIGMYGIVGQMQREEGAKKVRRGMTGVVRSGRNAGGKAYGYAPVAGKKGELAIVEQEADVIHRIFEMYITGIAPRSIAAALNAEGIAAPRGKQWNASTINGNGQRGNGILRNPIYAGQIVWNRVYMVKDPSTGRRVSRINSDDKIETVDAPHLRSIDEELFQAAKERKEATGGPHARQAPKNKRLLSGLLKCGQCGGGLSIFGSDRSGPRVVAALTRNRAAARTAAGTMWKRSNATSSIACGRCSPTPRLLTPTSRNTKPRASESPWSDATAAARRKTCYRTCRGRLHVSSNRCSLSPHTGICGNYREEAGTGGKALERGGFEEWSLGL
ncbi:recombinase family protein [Rhizobium sullae]|uniref:Recombinase family protein n=1 Tax=Rhizobium sullae TaxID=50338 RepID=A0ABY5XFL3_RHISU|nr:recombinase family protein [Rhizobium sullae]UWU13237.1 recombinase family protein [Rhizobium sullae]